MDGADIVIYDSMYVTKNDEIGVHAVDDVSRVGIIRCRLALATNETHNLVLALARRARVVKNNCQMLVGLHVAIASSQIRAQITKRTGEVGLYNCMGCACRHYRVVRKPVNDEHANGKSQALHEWRPGSNHIVIP